jgi:bifunctional ADP-heptose synthase (sugar kinase/adenylyltransferase)
MNEEIRIKLISTLSTMDEGKALIEQLKEYSKEVGDVSNIPENIIEIGGERLCEEVIGRIRAKEYLDNLLKRLVPTKKTIIKQIIK